MKKTGIMISVVLSVILSLVVSSVSLAWDFPYLVSDFTGLTPSLLVKNQSSASAHDVLYSSAYNFTNTVGVLSSDKAYKVTIKHTPSINIYTSANNGEARAVVNYFVLIGGKRFDFGNSSFLYFNVEGVSADYFQIGCDVYTSFYAYNNAIVDYTSVHTTVYLDNISYAITEITGYSDKGTAVLDGTLKQIDSKLASINTLSTSAFNELVKHTSSLSNIYTRLGTLDSTLNTISSRINYSNSLLNTINSGISSTNSKLDESNQLTAESNSLLGQMLDILTDSGGIDSGSVDSGLNDFDDVSNTVVFDNIDTLDAYSFDAATGQLSAGSNLFNAISFCTTYMTAIFDSSVYSEVFFVIAGLAFGCLLIGYARLWKGPTDFGGKSQSSRGSVRDSQISINVRSGKK